MTSKDIVLSYKPQAILRERDDGFYEIRDEESWDLLGLGKTPRKAWADAEEFLA